MKFKNFQTMTSTFGLLGAAALVPTAAFAQNSQSSQALVNDSAIVVTAQRREEKSLDVPITVTTLSQQTLQTANVHELVDITKVTPALRFDFGGGYFQPTLRGVGNSVVTSGGQGNVGIYVDGFYIANPLAVNVQLMKVQSIQVLKGPQGTLFGRNTTGGAILIQSADPSTETSAEVKASYGRFDEFRTQGYATFGLAENLAMDVEGSFSRGDGFRTNISNGKRVGRYQNWSVRTGIKAELGDNLSVLLRYQHGHTDDPTNLLAASYTESSPSSPLIPFTIANGAPFFAQPGEFTFNPNEVATGSNPNDQEFLRSDSDIFQATIKADLGFADLTSYTQFRKENVDSSLESDYSGVVVLELGLPNDNSTFSQEFLLNSKPGPKLQWTAGLFYFQNRDTYRVYFDYFPAVGIFSRGAEFGSSATTKSFAAFLDATYEITPKLFITAGARYSHDWITDAYTIAAFVPPPVTRATPADYDEVKRDKVTPRVVIRYKPSEDSSVYASFTKGYKAGIFDLGGGSILKVRPERITAYEVGYKFDSRTISLDVSGFYYDYKDLQVSLLFNGRGQIINAASSKIYGIEAQMRFNVSDHFQLNAGGAWVHARYTDFPGAPIYTPCLGLLYRPDPQCVPQFVRDCPDRPQKRHHEPHPGVHRQSRRALQDGGRRRAVAAVGQSAILVEILLRPLGHPVPAEGLREPLPPRAMG